MTAVPFVWGNAVEVLDLLMLIPNVSTARNPGFVNKITGISFTSDQLDFSRLQLYAPHTKHLTIYKRGYFKFLDWGKINYISEHDPVLPNLRSLRICGQELQPTQALLYVAWINWLKSPSLNSIFMFPRPTFRSFEPSISTFHVASIVQAISQGCPHITQLELPYCTTGNAARSESTDLMIGLLQTGRPENYLSNFNQLREFTSDTGFLTAGLLSALSKLPQLRTWTIRKSDESNAEFSEVVFSSDAFPSLEGLVMLDLFEPEMEEILDSTHAFSRLVSLEIEMELDENGWVLSFMFPRLKEMPRLTRLCLKFDFCAGENILNTPTALQILPTLPLQEVQLSGLTIGDSIDFATLFPQVKFLGLPSHYIKMHSLAPFARMPCLECLTISLVISEHTNYEQSSNLAFHTLKLSYDTDLPLDVNMLLQTARSLLGVWPNLSQVISSEEGSEPEFSQMIAAFQMCLSLLRKTQNLKTKIAEKYGQTEADSLVFLI
ncbi:hypothetical protein RhiJN_01831 [Ceratobasidium sp. AG-Ba]|nr:hypothetical protein RhiJN_01831 [Ceratobasidium sp. AG-Ba]